MKKTFACPLSVKSWEADGTFSGYASVFGIVDSQKEAVAKGAFQVSLKAWAKTGRLPKMLWQHDYRQPIGLWQEIREDAYGLFVKGQLLLDIAQGREAYTLLKNGVVDGLSIGFVTVRSSRKGASARVLEEVNLREISLVTFAANAEARVENVKMVDPVWEDLLQELEGLLHTVRGGGGRGS